MFVISPSLGVLMRVYANLQEKAKELADYLEENPYQFSFSILFYGAALGVIELVLANSGVEYYVKYISQTLGIVIIINYTVSVFFSEKINYKLVFKEETEIERALTVIRMLVWDQRIPYAIFIGGWFFYATSKIDQDLAGKIMEKETTSIMFFSLTPLVTWAFAVIKKDVEIGKLRSEWISEFRNDVAEVVSRAFWLSGKYGGYEKKEKIDLVYKELLKKDMIADAEVLLKTLKDEKKERDRMIEEVLEPLWRLETKLVSLDGKEWIEISDKLEDIRSSCMEKTRIINLQVTGEINGVRATPKRSYVKKVNSDIISSIIKLQYLSSLYLRVEWEEIKSYGKECKRTVTMIAILVMYIISSYINIFYKSIL